jgi:hypothetical protein
MKLPDDSVEPQYHIPLNAMAIIDEIIAKCDFIITYEPTDDDAPPDCIYFGCKKVEDAVSDLFGLVDHLPYKWFGLSPFQFDHFLDQESQTEFTARYFVRFFPPGTSHKDIGNFERRYFPERLGYALFRAEHPKKFKPGVYLPQFIKTILEGFRFTLQVHFEALGIPIPAPVATSAEDVTTLGDPAEAGPPAGSLPDNCFRAMADLKFEEITIEVVSDTSAKVTARGISQRFTCIDLGFRDGRKGDMPDTRWAILMEMATTGEISWDRPISESRRGQTKAAVKDIRRRLKAFFGIDDDPFFSYREVDAYRPKFHLRDGRFGGSR